MESLKIKEKKLERIIIESGKCAVAYSGGVDSLYLLNKCHELLKESVMAVTLKTPLTPEREFNFAVREAEKIGARHTVIERGIEDFSWFENNPDDRCYICKNAGFSLIKQEALKYGIDTIFDGTNIDDMDDYRPGMKAVKELGIISPLKEAGLTKDEIRQLSKEMGITGYDRASFTCLATRFPTGSKIEERYIKMVEEAEEQIFSLGFKEFRVRVHGDIARIEIGNELDRFIEREIREEVDAKLKEIGFRYVCCELGGYKRGNMNGNS